MQVRKISSLQAHSFVQSGISMQWGDLESLRMLVLMPFSWITWFCRKIFSARTPVPIWAVEPRRASAEVMSQSSFVLSSPSSARSRAVFSEAWCIPKIWPTGEIQQDACVLLGAYSCISASRRALIVIIMVTVLVSKWLRASLWYHDITLKHRSVPAARGTSS